ncbi:hypothetical protein L1887_41901 [Cichorium endivia]|nr:hypothetical protein L1887_41901 [Cichorium endivia]
MSFMGRKAHLLHRHRVVFGTGKSLQDGVKAFEAGDTMKLRVNRILNASGHASRPIGCLEGVIRFLYAGMESRMFGGSSWMYRGIGVGLAVTGKHVLKRYVPI